MIKVTVFYPNTPDAKFDMKYYVTHHMPMVRERCGPACRSIGAEQGLAGGDPGTSPPYLAIGQMTFDSVAEFQRSFGPHAADIIADVPNYTNIKPVLQISEVTL